VFTGAEPPMVDTEDNARKDTSLLLYELTIAMHKELSLITQLIPL
jgi:hypothetical protein